MPERQTSEIMSKTCLRETRQILSSLIATFIWFSASVAARSQTAPGLIPQSEHAQEIYTLAASQDGSLLASGGVDGTIKLREVASGRIITNWIGNLGPIGSLAFNPKGNALVSAGLWDPDITVRNILTGKSHKLHGLRVGYGNVEFALGGRVVIHGGPLGITVWRAETGEVLGSEPGSVECFALSSDGSRLFTGNADGELVAWRFGSADLPWPLVKENSVKKEGGIYSISVDPSGAEVITAGNTLDAWDSRSLRHRFSAGSRVVSVKRPAVFLGRDGLIGLVGVHEGAMGGQGGSYEEHDWITLWDAATGEFRGQVRASSSLNALCFLAASKSIAAAGVGGTVQMWQLPDLTEVARPISNVNGISGLVFLRDRTTLAMATGPYAFLWNLTAGNVISSLQTGWPEIQSFAASRDGEFLAATDGKGNVDVWSTTGRLIKRIHRPDTEVSTIAFSPDGNYLALGGSVGEIAEKGVVLLLNTRTWQLDGRLSAHEASVRSLAYSPDGRVLATGSTLAERDGKLVDSSTLKLWDAKSLRETPVIRGEHAGINALAFSPDGSALAVGRAAFDPSDPVKSFLWLGDATITEKDSARGEVVHSRTVQGERPVPSKNDLEIFDRAGNAAITAPYSGIVRTVAIRHDSKVLATGGADSTVRLWDIQKGEIISTLTGHGGMVSALAFDSVGGLMLSGAQDGATKVWDVRTPDEPKLMATLVASSARWLVVSPAGRFDASDLRKFDSLNWVFPDDPLRPLPPEIFMRDYYEPRLLPRLLAGDKLPDLPPLADLNRVQPLVEVADVRAGAQPDEVEVVVKVSGNRGEFQREGRSVTMETDVHDVRLFRGGQLVGQWPEPEAGSVLKNGVTLTPAELLDWRKATNIPLTGGKAWKSFTVRLPHQKAGEKIEFTAYAFNVDRVKSATATREYTVPKDLAPVKPRAYVISVGVNAYENPAWNLRFAVSDAKRMEEALATSRLTKQFEVVPVLLTSDGRIGGSGDHATKAAFRAVLDTLAGKGKELPPPVLSGVVNADRLAAARPDDLVILTMSSHGYTDEKGMFYLIPSDSGQTDGRQITPSLMKRWISSDELSEWLRGVDAGDLVMIVDTCHSAATVEAPGFKPGPMGSRGLGQLAYDKGMRILAASQANDVALESEKIKQGLLTYALVENGLVEHQAAGADGKGEITLDGWLQYGADRVPKLYEELRKTGKVRALAAGSRDPKLNVVLSGGTSSLKNNAFQQPSLFDFSHHASISLPLQ